MNVLDLFSGIGGFSLGLERAGMKTVAFCEIEPFCQKVLKKHWPNVPIIEDVRNVTKERLEAIGIYWIDVIAGGFPCQAFSTAARGRNDRSKDLHREFCSVVRRLQPRLVIAENVSRKAVDLVSEKLVCDGRYVTHIFSISAAQVGADHKRNRWWLIAHTDHESKFCGSINAKVAGLRKAQNGIWTAENYARAVRVSDGIPNRMDRIAALGNAVVPQIPEIIGRAIMAVERGESCQY